MEIRKLIKFGNNSFIVSLPKPWIVKNKLIKGSLIYVLASGNQLVLSPQKAKVSLEDKNITLDFRDEPYETMRRKIIACYINNYKQMKILFTSNKAAQEIRTIIQNLMALEVIEQGSNIIIAKDYLNMSDISISNLSRKMDTIIRTMFSDIIETLKKGDFKGNTDLADNIAARDSDINRLAFLIMRYVKYVLVDPELKSEGDDYDYLSYYELAQFLERIADELKRSARYVTRDEFSNVNDIKDLFIDTEKLYLNAMKTYYNKDREQAYKVATEKNPVLNKVLAAIDKHEKDFHTQRVLEMQRRIVSIVSSLLRLVYQ
jgi:phosphate uptake regulator